MGRIAGHFPCADTDAFVLMPNHIHSIVVIGEPGPTCETGGGETPPLPAADGQDASPAFAGRPTLGQIVAYFKYQSARRINALWGAPGTPLWQRNYYERIVRNEAELKRLRRYIEENPARWALDRENPAIMRGTDRP